MHPDTWISLPWVALTNLRGCLGQTNPYGAWTSMQSTVASLVWGVGDLSIPSTQHCTAAPTALAASVRDRRQIWRLNALSGPGMPLCCYEDPRSLQTKADHPPKKIFSKRGAHGSRPFEVRCCMYKVYSTISARKMVIKASSVTHSKSEFQRRKQNGTAKTSWR